MQRDDVIQRIINVDVTLYSFSKRRINVDST